MVVLLKFGSNLALLGNIVPLWIGDNPCKYDGYVYDLETIAGPA
jgi:hypothetical protein